MARTQNQYEASIKINGPISSNPKNPNSDKKVPALCQAIAQRLGGTDFISFSLKLEASSLQLLLGKDVPPILGLRTLLGERFFL